MSRWPLPHYSAGHERIFSLIGSLIKNNYEVSLVCDEDSDTKDLSTYPLELIQVKGSKLLKLPNAKIALFDTYKTANRYSQELYNRANNVIQILDLQDVHGLR